MIENKQVLKIKSQLNEIGKIEAFIEQLSDTYKLDTTYYGNILIAVTEAVHNAIIHGNKLNPNKHVTVYFEYLSNGFSFVIEDEGEGFDYNHLPDPLDITREINGRGIYLIKTLSDDTEYSKNGSILKVNFLIENFNRETAMKRINQLKAFGEIKQGKTSEQIKLNDSQNN